MKLCGTIAAAGAALFFLCSAAQAGLITLCNNYPVTVHVALAGAVNGNYTAAGWWTVAPSACQNTDFALQGPILYYAADSDNLPDGSYFHWGSAVQLFVSNNKFNFNNAETNQPNTAPEKFDLVDTSKNSQGTLAAIKVTFNKTGNSSATIDWTK